LAIARATCLKFVIRHFAPSPTSEARRCSAAAAAGLRRALRIAAIRFSASCFFICLKVIFFTEN
jgi:predicted nucleic acid-binding Zn ribbon protein